MLKGFFAVHLAAMCDSQMEKYLCLIYVALHKMFPHRNEGTHLEKNKVKLEKTPWWGFFLIVCLLFWPIPQS